MKFTKKQIALFKKFANLKHVRGSHLHFRKYEDNYHVLVTNNNIAIELKIDEPIENQTFPIAKLNEREDLVFEPNYPDPIDWRSQLPEDGGVFLSETWTEHLYNSANLLAPFSENSTVEINFLLGTMTPCYPKRGYEARINTDVGNDIDYKLTLNWGTVEPAFKIASSAYFFGPKQAIKLNCGEYTAWAIPSINLNEI